MPALAKALAAVGLGGAGALALLTREPPEGAATLIDYERAVPGRAEQLRRLREGTRDKPFDVLIVGGGATGTGCALDAATRGLR